MTSLVNGEEIAVVSLADRGLQYGDGLFETIALRHGEPLLWEQHLQRLIEGCQRLGITAPDKQQLYSELKKISAKEPRAVVKIIVTRTSSIPGYQSSADSASSRILQRLPWPVYPADAAQGVMVRWCQMRLARQPCLAGIKHLNRLEQVLARAEWQHEYAEGLMCDSEGHVIEGTRTNLFLVSEDGTLVTPDLSQSGVAGVMRAQILECAKGLGLHCRVQVVTREQVEHAQELFLSNSLIGLWPITRLEARHYVVGTISQKIQAALQATGSVAC